MLSIIRIALVAAICAATLAVAPSAHASTFDGTCAGGDLAIRWKNGGVTLTQKTINFDGDGAITGCSIVSHPEVKTAKVEKFTGSGNIGCLASDGVAGQGVMKWLGADDSLIESTEFKILTLGFGPGTPANVSKQIILKLQVHSASVRFPDAELTITITLTESPTQECIGGGIQKSSGVPTLTPTLAG